MSSTFTVIYLCVLIFLERSSASESRCNNNRYIRYDLNGYDINTVYFRISKSTKLACGIKCSNDNPKCVAFTMVKTSIGLIECHLLRERQLCRDINNFDNTLLEYYEIPILRTNKIHQPSKNNSLTVIPNANDIWRAQCNKDCNNFVAVGFSDDDGLLKGIDDLECGVIDYSLRVDPNSAKILQISHELVRCSEDMIITGVYEFNQHWWDLLHGYKCQKLIDWKLDYELCEEKIVKINEEVVSCMENSLKPKAMVSVKKDSTQEKGITSIECCPVYKTKQN